MAEENTVDPVTLELIKSQEGYSSKAYVDARGHSIGYGHFIKKGEEHLLGTEMSEEEAEKLLVKDIKSHQQPWESKLTKKLGNAQMAALTSFAYNVGPAAVLNLVPEINRGNFDKVYDTMRSYRKAHVDGEFKVLDVLVKRREFEIGLFQRGVDRDEDDTSILKSVFVKPFRSNINAGKDWKSQKGFFKRLKESLTGPERFVQGMFDPGELINQNKEVLGKLMDLNANMGARSPVNIDEQAWATRVMQEGRGWGAN